MSTINSKKLKKLLDEVPGLDSETRKKIEEANKSPRPRQRGWGHGAPTPKVIKVDPL